MQSLGQADQILLSRFPFDSARQALKGEELHGIEALSWLNHGPYRMKGVEEPSEICEVGEAGKAKLMQPPDSEKAHRFAAAPRPRRRRCFLPGQVRFRSFEDDLVDDRQWKDKERLMAETGLSFLRQPIREQLAELEEQLESRIAEVNGRIATRENEHFELEVLEMPGRAWYRE